MTVFCLPAVTVALPFLTAFLPALPLLMKEALNLPAFLPALPLPCRPCPCRTLGQGIASARTPCMGRPQLGVRSRAEVESVVRTEEL